MKQCGFSEVHGLWIVSGCGFHWKWNFGFVETALDALEVDVDRNDKVDGNVEKRICELFVFLLQGPEQREIRDGKKQNNKEVDGDPLVLLEQH